LDKFSTIHQPKQAFIYLSCKLCCLSFPFFTWHPQLPTAASRECKILQQKVEPSSTCLHSLVLFANNFSLCAKSAIHAQAPMLRNTFSDANWIKVADYQKFCAAEMFRAAGRFTLPQVLQTLERRARAESDCVRVGE
jgi:hypothetical protein